jgi:hypothetical protein
VRRAPAGGRPPAPPGAPTPRLWKLTGYGKLRAATRPLRTFPHPLEILGARPPPQDSHSSHSRDGEVGKQTKRRDEMTDSEAVNGPQGGHFDPP